MQFTWAISLLCGYAIIVTLHMSICIMCLPLNIKKNYHLITNDLEAFKEYFEVGHYNQTKSSSWLS